MDTWKIVAESFINIIEVLFDTYFLSCMFPARRFETIPAKFGRVVSWGGTVGFAVVYAIHIFLYGSSLPFVEQIFWQVLIMLAYVMLFRSGHKGWKVAIVIIINGVFIGVYTGTTFLFQSAFGVAYSDLMDLTGFRYVWIAIYHIAYFCILWGILHVRNSISQRIPPHNYLMLAFPLYSIGLLVLLDIMISINHDASLQKTCMVIAFLAVVLDIAIMTVFIQNSKKYEEVRELKELRIFTDQQKRYYEALIASYNEIRTWRHDIKHQLCAIGAAISRGEYEKAQTHIESSLDESNTILQTFAASGNVMVDGLMAFKQNDAKRNDIEMNVDMILPDSIVLSDFELCRLLGNLVDNAIEACLHISDVAKRYINIVVVPQNANISIRVINSTAGNVIKESNTYLSTKDDGKHEGLGLRSIDKIVDSVGGYITRSHKDCVFTTDILLPCILIGETQREYAS